MDVWLVGWLVGGLELRFLNGFIGKTMLWLIWLFVDKAAPDVVVFGATHKSDSKTHMKAFESEW